MVKDKRAIAQSFGGAAQTYDAVSEVQALAARRLSARVRGDWTTPAILDLGAGTGHLAMALRERFPEGHFTLADIAPEMLLAARAKFPGPDLVVADAEALPFSENSFDVIAANLAVQWCDDLAGSLARLAALLRPGGMLAVTTLLSGTWAEWRDAHHALGLSPAMLALPDMSALRQSMPWAGQISAETLVRPYRRGREFLRDIFRLGAGMRDGPALPRGDLARVLRQFEANQPVASYEIATITLRRPSRCGVLIAGTGTGIGKTVVSAILARAWNADYWKPAQTGLAEEAGDTAWVETMGIVCHPPRHALGPALSPYNAALLEGQTLEMADFVLPCTGRPLVVESAGGVASPLDASHDMTDLAVHLGLPAVLVARSELGTINHTLLAIDHLRQSGVFLLGVVMVGDQNPANRREIERRGNVHILLECPQFERLDRETIAAAAANVPSLAKLGWTFFAAQGWFNPC